MPVEDETVTEEDTSEITPLPSPIRHEDSTVTPSTVTRSHIDDQENSSPFSAQENSTPRSPTIATYSSPYETLRRQVQGKATDQEDEPSTSTLPSTPRGQVPWEAPPESSPFLPPSTTRQQRTPANDVLLHRVLDKNYRLQATPHSQARAPKPAMQQKLNTQTPVTTAKKPADRPLFADDLDSSPPIPAPELRGELFDSPARAGRNGRIPGVSVLTPGRKMKEKRKSFGGQGASIRTPGALGATGNSKSQPVHDPWDDSDDEEDDPDAELMEGMSPPKTMQFHIPQSKLLQTPGKAYPTELHNLCWRLRFDILN